MADQHQSLFLADFLQQTHDSGIYHKKFISFSQKNQRNFVFLEEKSNKKKLMQKTITKKLK